MPCRAMALTLKCHRVRHVSNTLICLGLQQGYHDAVENLILKNYTTESIKDFRPPSPQTDYHNFYVYQIAILYRITS